MQGGDPDLAWAAAVQDGTVVTRGAWKGDRRVQQQRKGSQHGRTSPSTGGSGAGARHGRAARRPDSRPGHRQQQQPRRQQRQQDVQQQQQQQPAGSGSGGDALAAYGRPGPSSTARVAHCEACDVWVPRRAGDWEVHVEGIRHRRQLLSLRVHGERNRLVLSAFEAPPDFSSAAAQRLVGRAAADFGLAGADQQQRLAAPPELAAAARKLRTEALKQLLNMFGVGQVYSGAAASFDEARLAAALQQAADGCGGSSASDACRLLACRCGAELAAVAHAAQMGLLGRAAELDVVLVQPPPDAPRSQHASLAAALPLLLAPLQRSASLARLTLTLPRTSGGDAARLAQLWQAAWQHLQPALCGLLGSSAPLRQLRLVLPPCLREAVEAGMPQLAAAAAAAPVALRRQVLLALHPRAGRCSLLQLLPLAVLREVLDQAAPLQPCSITLEWAA